MSKPLADPVFDIGKDLQEAYEKGYKQGRYDEKVETKMSLSKWIPVSERLPEKDGNYLVCMRWNYRSMDVLMWVDGWNCIRRIDGKVDRESEIDGADILAWMPLPEPYRDEYELATEKMEHDVLYEPTYNPEDGSM